MDLSSQDYAQEPDSLIPLALLTHEEALDLVLDDCPEEKVLPNWKIEDLSALLLQITRYKCDRSGVERFADRFENTTVDEICNAIKMLRDLNTQAASSRFCCDKTVAAEKHANSEGIIKPETKDWLSVAVQINKTRKISDESSILLPKILSGLPSTSQAAVNSQTSSHNPVCIPDFSNCYQHLCAILTSRSVHKARSVDAAVLLKIFDEMEKDAENFEEHTEFFRAMFCNMQSFDPMDFKLDSLDTEGIGKSASNILNLPDSFLDLSAYVPPEQLSKN